MVGGGSLCHHDPRKVVDLWGESFWPQASLLQGSAECSCAKGSQPSTGMSGCSYLLLTIFTLALLILAPVLWKGIIQGSYLR